MLLVNPLRPRRRVRDARPEEARMKDRDATRPAVIFWLWMIVTAGGLAAMFAIVIGGR